MESKKTEDLETLIATSKKAVEISPVPPEWQDEERRPAITRLFSRVETHLADRATRERQGMTKPASIQQRIRRRLTR